jgi:tetratricopeptide (TPR) repeat protein
VSDSVSRLSAVQEETFGQLANQVARDLYLKRLDAAAAGVRQLLEMSPQSTTALELQGDILRAQGQAKAAREIYRQAMQAEPANADAERKYAELSLETQHDLWDREALLAGDLERFRGAPHKSPAGAALRSLLFPGLGQLYNGDSELGVALAAVGLGLFMAVLLLFAEPIITAALVTLTHKPATAPGVWGWLSLVALLALSCYSAYEAYQAAPQPSGKA